MKKIILTTLLLTFTFLSTLRAQERPRFSPEDFKAKMEAYIIKETGMTPQEASKFFSIFNEMNKELREINGKIFSMTRQQEKTCVTDKQFSDLIAKIDQLKLQSARLEVDYHKKLEKAVSSKKVFLALKAEKQFHRRMLKNMAGGQPRKKNGEKLRQQSRPKPMAQQCEATPCEI